MCYKFMARRYLYEQQFTGTNKIIVIAIAIVMITLKVIEIGTLSQK